jgi:hypothetical protein
MKKTKFEVLFGVNCNRGRGVAVTLFLVTHMALLSLCRWRFQCKERKEEKERKKDRKKGRK